ncbi:hypothetical protein J0895_14115 [Phormidium pseudopriestleyi FRX01]|uniref:Uncharacterized protein n=1 Tax=Phormidium pseudopriestleyi FRX01 TaxID=1759528 RepID=A0ABS3FSZ3_9CYAN|nr:hypothetical protein [Phormidium pseudopriestleyi]MBO0350226.1 hypothetical protein [Phormidium pseudopriestleyi FRX01]
MSRFTADEWCVPHRRHSAIAQQTDGIESNLARFDSPNGSSEQLQRFDARELERLLGPLTKRSG